MADDKTRTVRKTDFATMCGVTPARVSQWINEKKLTGDALEGVGRRAKINVVVAIEQLKARLDASQRFGLNGLSTRLDTALAAPAPQLPFAEPPGDGSQLRELDVSIEREIKSQKLRQAQLQTARLEEQDRLSRGIYVLAKDAQATNAKLSGDLLGAFEGEMAALASGLAGQFSLPNRDVLFHLRRHFRAFRQRIAQRYAADAECLPETIEDLGTYDQASH